LKAFFPFSLGPRKCVGRDIAWLEIRVFVGKLLWGFDLEGVRGHERSLDRDFRSYIFLEAMELYVRFLPAQCIKL
jgi:cytochrome P450